MRRRRGRPGSDTSPLREEQPRALVAQLSAYRTISVAVDGGGTSAVRDLDFHPGMGMRSEITRSGVFEALALVGKALRFRL